MSLTLYHRKRNFEKTGEPPGKVRKASPSAGIFVVQKHAASRLHYDFRLEWKGLLKSWAVPRGPSLNPRDKRLAVQVEDHPYEYKDFEGIIPAGEYGGGSVLVWDQGTWQPSGDVERGLREGKLRFELKGQKLQGRWLLLRMKGGGRGTKTWLLVKEKDEHASSADIAKEAPDSVVSGLGLQEIAKKKGRTWRSRHSKLRAPDPSPSQEDELPPTAWQSPLPDFIPPQLARLSKEVPRSGDWIYEVKFDGYRALGRINHGQARLLSRGNQDWSARFPAIAEALSALPAEQAIVDGEIVKAGPDGNFSFQALQNSLCEGNEEDIRYYLFDLLHCNGHDLRALPLEQRRQTLAKLLQGRDDGPLRFSESVMSDGKDFYKAACRLALEGIVAKRKDLPYEAGRSDAWVKVKCANRQEFIICGYTPPYGKRKRFGALLLGYYEAGGLRYAGLVGTGFSDASLGELHEKMLPLRQDKPLFPIPAAIRRKHPQWIRPKLVAEIEFGEWTRDGLLRHPSFEGLREDKSAEEVVREAPQSAKSKDRTAFQPLRKASLAQVIEAPSLVGVRISHPEKILYAEQGISKWEITEYYEAVAERLLPHLRDRPLSLVRCPSGSGKKCFYQKHVPPRQAELETIEIEEKSGRDLYVMANDERGLLSLVQIGILEIHPWGAQVQDLEAPDLMIFDLDPPSAAEWKQVVEGARLLHALLDELKLKNFLKTTGGKGLHVVVPLSGANTWEEVKDFSKKLAEAVALSSPKRYTVELMKAKRQGRIFIDYLRNSRGATAIAPYSTRARPGAPIAVSLAWEELEARMRSDHFNIKNISKRLARSAEPWKGFFSLKQSLPG